MAEPYKFPDEIEDKNQPEIEIEVEGDVEIAYSLDAAGAVTEARVAKSTPPMVFDQAALESFRKWRFTPMLDKAGQPIAAGGFAFTVAFRMKQ